jgi:hypothetical protein
MVPAPQSSRTTTLPNISVVLSSLLSWSSLCLLVTVLFSAICRLFALFGSLFSALNNLFSSRYRLFLQKYEGWSIPQGCGGSAFPHARTHFRGRLRASMSRLFKVFVVAPSICYAVPAKRSGNRRVSSCSRQRFSPAPVPASAPQGTYLLPGTATEARVVHRQTKRT